MCAAPSRAQEEEEESGGKEAHDRHASPSVRTCSFFLHLLRLLFSVRRSTERFRGRGRERKSETNEEEEEPDARRGVRGRERTSGEEESERKRKRRRPRETDVQQRRAMQNLTVQGTGASDDGSGNSCSFHPRGILSLTPFFRCTVPVRSLARSLVRPPASSCVK